MTETAADIEPASARAEATFIKVLTDELHIQRTVGTDMVCRLILYRLVQLGFVLVPLPDDIATSIAEDVTPAPEDHPCPPTSR